MTESSSDEPIVESAAQFVGQPDGFERLWTPHRLAYVEGDKPSDETPGQCPFCQIPSRDDAAGLLVHRGQLCFVAMNLYPYSPGHVLICPYRHVADLIALTREELAELYELSVACVRVIREVSAPRGFNLGMNLGEVAGAGIQAHLHQHVVPRWPGDANFMPVIGQTKPVPQLLEVTRQLLADRFAAS